MAPADSHQLHWLLEPQFTLVSLPNGPPVLGAPLENIQESDVLSQRGLLFLRQDLREEAWVTSQSNLAKSHFPGSFSEVWPESRKVPQFSCLSSFIWPRTSQDKRAYQVWSQSCKNISLTPLVEQAMCPKGQAEDQVALDSGWNLNFSSGRPEYLCIYLWINCFNILNLMPGVLWYFVFLL